MKITRRQLRQIIKEEICILGEGREHDTIDNAIKLFLEKYPKFAQTAEKIEGWRDQMVAGIWYLRHPDLSKTAEVRIAEVGDTKPPWKGGVNDPTMGGRLPAVELDDLVPDWGDPTGSKSKWGHSLDSRELRSIADTLDAEDPLTPTNECKMKITRRQLRQIIKEEAKMINESKQHQVANTVEMLHDLLIRVRVDKMTPEQKSAVVVEIDWLIENLPIFKNELGS